MSELDINHKEQNRKKAVEIVASFYTLVQLYYQNEQRIDFYLRLLSISKRDLNYIIWRNCKKSPIAIIKEMLAADIKAKLMYTEIPMKVLSCSYGFKSPATFTKFIRTATGLTPTRFRALRCLEKENMSKSG